MGPDVGCYAPPKLYENELKESLQAPGFENWSYTVENVDGALQVLEKRTTFNMKNCFRFVMKELIENNVYFNL